MIPPARHDLLQFIRQKRVVGSPSTVILAHFQIPVESRTASSVTSLRSRIASSALVGAEAVFPFGPWLFAVTASAKQAVKVQQDFRRIDEFLEIRRLGRLKIETFLLPNDTHKIFAALDRDGGEAVPAIQLNEIPDENRAREVDALLAIERMLRTADISNLIRERPVYDFTNPATPELVRSELVVDIAEIGRIGKANIRKRPWLLTEVTRLLDYRVIAHILREPAHRTGNTSINLHIDTVMSDEFQDFVDRLDAEQAALPSVELDIAEIKAFPDIAARAVARLSATGCATVIDGIPANTLVTRAERLPEIAGCYKFDWRNSIPLDAADFDAAAVGASIAPELDRFGRDNCVLLHCHTPLVIERGLAIGFTRLEGFEITKYIASPAFRSARAPGMRRAKPREPAQARA